MKAHWSSEGLIGLQQTSCVADLALGLVQPDLAFSCFHSANKALLEA